MATYAFSDIHGMYKIWEQIRDYCKEDDKIYFLGDAIDRGKEGMKTMKEILADPRVIYLKGNHEQLMRDEIKDIWRTATEENLSLEEIQATFYYTSNWLRNGGSQTLKSALKMNWKQINELCDTIDKMPVVDMYTNTKGQDIILCHAGFSIYAPEISAWDMIWDRKHIAELWSNEEMEETDVIVHGHTPVINLHDEPYMIYKYCDGHKIDIDLGSYHTKTAALLNLDTLEAIYFF
jgi:serine/threonine protein phosphatase 1